MILHMISRLSSKSEEAQAQSELIVSMYAVINTVNKQSAPTHDTARLHIEQTSNHFCNKDQPVSNGHSKHQSVY